MKKILLLCITLLFLVPGFAQITIENEKVIPCNFQPSNIALSPDGSILLVGGDSKKIYVYNTNTGEELPVITIKGIFTIFDLQFAPDGKSFSVAGDYYLIVFNAKTFEEMFSFHATNGVFSSISYSPDSKKIIGSYFNTSTIYDLTKAEAESNINGDSKITKVAWSPSSTNIALVDHDNKITFWDITKEKQLISTMFQKELLNDLSFGRNGNFLYTCSAAGYIYIFNVLNGENTKLLTFNGHYPNFVLPVFSFESLLSGGEDGRLICWETSDYKPRILLQYPKYRLLSSSMSLSNNKIAIGISDKSVHILTIKNDDLYLIKQIVSKKTKNWQQQGKFEKSGDYIRRVNDSTRILQIDYFTQWGIDSLGQAGKTWALQSTDYDADNEIFKLNFVDYPPVHIRVPITEAESFDQSVKSLIFTNPKFTVGGDSNVLIHLDITNPSNNRSYSYDKKEATAFNPDKLELEFDPINITIPKTEALPLVSGKEPGVNTASIISDIDQNLPLATDKYADAYALIIGNEDYTKYNSTLSPESNVPFARNDAKSFYNYAVKVLGIPAENIFCSTDAIGSVMKREIERICKMSDIKDGKADIFFYYAGHGLPDEETKESYILPIDISAENIKDGIKLKDLYQKFASSKAHRTFVIVDACFSGEGRNQSLLAARAIRIKPQEAPLEGNIVVLTAVKSDQRSLPYNQQKHGIFTYFLLKHLKETNGSSNLADLEKYLNEEVPITSLKLFGIEQTPQISSGIGIDPKWKNWTMNKKD